MKGLSPKGAECKVSKFSSIYHNRYTVTKHPTSKAFELLSIAMEEAMCSQPFTSSSKMEYKTVTNYEWHAIVLFPTVDRPTDRKFLAYYSNHWFCSSTIFFLAIFASSESRQENLVLYLLVEQELFKNRI